MPRVLPAPWVQGFTLHAVRAPTAMERPLPLHAVGAPICPFGELLLYGTSFFMVAKIHTFSIVQTSAWQQNAWLFHAFGETVFFLEKRPFIWRLFGEKVSANSKKNAFGDVQKRCYLSENRKK